MLIPIVALVIVALSAGASFLFALAETALFSLGKWQTRQLTERSAKRGALVQQLLDQPQDLLAAIVLGNTVANAAIVGVALWMALEGQWSIWLALPSTLLIVLVGGEVLPKTLAVRAPDAWALRIAVPMAWMLNISRPVQRAAQSITHFILTVMVPKSIKPATGLSDADYHELIELAHQQGALAKSEKEIILQIISLDQRMVRDVMQPRSRLACIPDDLSIEDMLTAARKFRHRRLPMYDETPDTIVGVLDTRSLLLDPNVDLADAIEFPSFVPETMNLLQLLKSLQRQHRGMALVLDEFGGTAGIVTMEDILGEVFGRARTTDEATGFVMKKLGEGRWRVNGTMRLDDFRREYPALPDVPEVETMGGLLIDQCEVVPAQGQSIHVHGLKLTAQAVDERRVREVLVEISGRGGRDA